jgi:hypothetical protein
MEVWIEKRRVCRVESTEPENQDILIIRQQPGEAAPLSS